MDLSEAKRFHAECGVGREVLTPLAQSTRAERGKRA
jgi:hypothetical protein